MGGGAPLVRYRTVPRRTLLNGTVQYSNSNLSTDVCFFFLEISKQNFCRLVGQHREKRKIQIFTVAFPNFTAPYCTVFYCTVQCSMVIVTFQLMCLSS
jgi:hypothetical protein